jgi:plastocyanin domain-containing protein
VNLAAINAGAIAVIALIVWWFWLSSPRARRESGSAPIDILVDNGVYTPARIEVPAGQPVVLRFLRKDPSPCAEKVLFDDLSVAADLPVDKPTEVEIAAAEPGEHEFTCQMHMYRGTLVVRPREPAPTA